MKMGSRYKKAILPDHMHESFDEWVASARTKAQKGKETTNGGTVDKYLWGAWNRKKAKNGGNKPDAETQSGEEMQEIQQEGESQIEIGIHE
jgi:hypothetical protein